MDKKIFISICSLLILFGMMSGTTSCANVPLRASALSDGYERSVSEDGEITDGFTAAMAKFSGALLKKSIEHTEKGENTLISPLSAVLCLGLLANGAEQNTLEEIETLVGMSREELNPAIYAFVQSLSSDENCKVTLANSVWYKNEGLHIEESYLQNVANWYDAEQYSAPFDASTAKDINKWVDRNTDGMIREITDERTVQSAVMYLINTLLFDAKWQEEYENRQIKKEFFTSYNGEQQSAQMMYSEESRFLETEGAVGFAKNYKGGKYSFVCLLPNESIDVYELAAGLDGEEWLRMWNNSRHRDIHAKIPEFKFESNIPLKEMLIELGVSEMFGSNADFTSMGYGANGSLYCTNMAQKTVIDVSREGTKAAAVTWADMAESAPEPEAPINIFLDRPFVCAIVDNATGLPLFVGVTASIG